MTASQFEEECKAKLQELDIRCLELEDCLASERLVSEQLRAKIDYASVHVSSEVEALNVSVEAADRTLRSLTETLKRYTDLYRFDARGRTLHRLCISKENCALRQRKMYTWRCVHDANWPTT